ncbi:MAG: molybdenum cofactor guanylyltransferase [Pseudomonadales bacterium]|nr:molybdenum cofactor guanylyltransferase [Pseudomonadales bacterium]
MPNNQIPATTPRIPITALILSGGKGKRMGYIDKGLVLLNNKPLVEHVLDRIQPQVDEIILSCNQNKQVYQKFGLPLVSDQYPGDTGPLAGILSAANIITSPLCFITACDMPYLPNNLIEKLATQLDEHAAITVSVEGQLQPLASVIRTRELATITAFLNSGQRSIKKWLTSINTKVITIDAEDTAFKNINYLDQLS